MSIQTPRGIKCGYCKRRHPSTDMVRACAKLYYASRDGDGRVTPIEDVEVGQWFRLPDDDTTLILIKRTATKLRVHPIGLDLGERYLRPNRKQQTVVVVNPAEALS